MCILVHTHRKLCVGQFSVILVIQLLINWAAVYWLPAGNLKSWSRFVSRTSVLSYYHSPSVFTQATHPNMRTYYFCTDTAKEMESWMKVMTDAALVHTEPVRRLVLTTGIYQTDKMVGRCEVHTYCAVTEFYKVECCFISHASQEPHLWCVLWPQSLRSLDDLDEPSQTSQPLKGSNQEFYPSLAWSKHHSQQHLSPIYCFWHHKTFF